MRALPVAKSKTALFFGEQDSRQRLLIYITIFFFIGYALLIFIKNIAYIGFYVTDDVTIQNLLNGSMGPSDGMCIYLNVILGSFIAFLYRAFSGINWYAVILLIILMFSNAVISAMVAQRLGGKAGFAIGFALYPLIFLFVLLHFTYTIIAYVVLTAALAGLVYAFYLKGKKIRRLLWISAAVLGVLSVMIRAEVIISAAAFGAVYACFLLIRYKRKALRTIIMVGGVLALALVLNLINTVVYQSNPIWNDYLKFNHVRTSLVDYAHPTYEQNQAAFQKYGWSENDYELFYSHNIPDDPKFSTENLQKIEASYDALGRYDFNILDILSSISSLINSLAVLVALVTAFYFALTTSKAKLLSVAVFVFPFAIQALLVIVERPLMYVIYPHYIIAIVLLLCMIDVRVLKERFKKNADVKKKFFLPLIALILILAGTFYPIYSTVNSSMNLAAQRQNQNNINLYNRVTQLYEYLHQLRSYIVYPLEPAFYNYNNSQSIFETTIPDEYSNIFGLGNWPVRSVRYDSFKQAMGIQSLPRDLIDNDQIYFVGDFLTGTDVKLDLYTKYFYETYGILIKYEVVADFNEYYIMKIKTAASLSQMGTVYKEG